MAKWTVDAMHSNVEFKVKHLMINTVTGSFKNFDISVEGESEDFTDAKINFTADVASITTGIEDRDNHLRSDDFFNAETYPKMIFTSSSMEKTGDTTYTLTGDLTIRDITKTISLDVEFGGTMVDPYGNTKAGFELNGKLNRKEFGLKWDAITEAGGVVVSDQVRLHLNIQLMAIGQEQTQEEAVA